MSWDTINQLLGRAMIDEQFASKLLKDPLVAILEDGYDLNLEEKAVLQNARPRNIVELSQILLTQLKNEYQED